MYNCFCGFFCFLQGGWDDYYSPLVALSECGVCYKYVDEFDCTVGIDYMLIWFKGLVFGGINTESDFVDPRRLAVVIHCTIPDDIASPSAVVFATYYGLDNTNRAVSITNTLPLQALAILEIVVCVFFFG